MTELMPDDRSFPWLKTYPAGIDYRVPIRIAPLFKLIDDAAVNYGDRPAIDFMGKLYTYRQLHALIERAAAGFQRLGVGKGTRVGLVMPNCPYYAIAYFAVLKAGGTVVNFNPLYTAKEVMNQLNDSGATIMVTVDVRMIFDKLASLLDKTALQTLIVCPMAGILPFPKSLLYPFAKAKEIATLPNDERCITFAKLIAGPATLTPVKIDPLADIALLQYTGGTTGVPKGAMLSHANVYANTVQSVLWMEGAEAGVERVLAVLPFFHVFGMTTELLFGIYVGAMIIALPRFELNVVLKTIAQKKPTIFPAVPTIYNAINHHPRQKDYDLSSIRYCISGGAPLPVEVKETFERITGCTLVEGYGLSETSPVASGNPINGVNKPGSIGVPVPGTVIEIVSLDDRKTLMPPGDKGEICISGPQVMLGYWNQPEESAVALEGGHFHTGDIGYMDEDGYTFIVDRLKDIIIAGGFKIYPRHIEEAVYQHPAIEEAIAAGIPDEYRGQTVKLWVKLQEGAVLSESDLKAFLSEHLSAIEMPKLIEFRTTPLPKTLIGKLSRKAILEEDAKHA